MAEATSKTVPTFNEWLISKVRKFMRDEPRRNKLLATYEHSDEEICDAIVDTVGYINSTPPNLSTAFTLETYPSTHLFLLGCAIYLLQSESFLRARNHLTYNDGSLTINDDDKWQVYMQMIDRMQTEYKQELLSLKAAMNEESMYRSQYSPYANLYDSYRVYSSLRK